MGDRARAGPGLIVREGRPDDEAFVVGLGATAFARFGEYGPVMRAFLASPEVVSFIAEAAGERVGFALVDRPASPPAFADLVAIAVDPHHRRTGVGRALLLRVIASLEERSEHFKLAEVLDLLRALPIDTNVVPVANRRKKLLIADMDSTMIHQECIDELGVMAGVGDRIKRPALPFWTVFLGDITRDPCRVREVTLWYKGFPDHFFFWRNPQDATALLVHFDQKLKHLLV